MFKIETESVDDFIKLLQFITGEGSAISQATERLNTARAVLQNAIDSQSQNKETENAQSSS